MTEPTPKRQKRCSLALCGEPSVGTLWGRDGEAYEFCLAHINEYRLLGYSDEPVKKTIRSLREDQ